MSKLITAERRNKIAELIISNGSIKVGELAKTFAVSTETIRKDLIYLDKQGIIKKKSRWRTVFFRSNRKTIRR